MKNMWIRRIVGCTLEKYSYDDMRRQLLNIELGDQAELLSEMFKLIGLFRMNKWWVILGYHFALKKIYK